MIGGPALDGASGAFADTKGEFMLLDRSYEDIVATLPKTKRPWVEYTMFGSLTPWR